jgi:hypothetical protein
VQQCGSIHATFPRTRQLVDEMPHAQVMRAIELFGTEVAPAVRKALAGSGA